VLVGIIFAKQYWWIDSVLGGAISIMLFYATYQIAREAITKLLGEKPGNELIEKISALIRPLYDGDLQVHHFHIHNYVTHQELTFHIKLANSTSIEAGHKIATDIENKIHQQFGIIATVHMEPYNYKHDSD
jgi:divalent metal cation (Fe/Co/Zn/Cd) transporter